MKKRIIGLDILRVLGIVFIFLYHVTDSYVGLGGTGDGVFSSLALFSILSRPASIFLFLISGFARKKFRLNLTGGLKTELYNRTPCEHLFRRTDNACK